jgi:hypothetical protein
MKLLVFWCLDSMVYFCSVRGVIFPSCSQPIIHIPEMWFKFFHLVVIVPRIFIYLSDQDMLLKLLRSGLELDFWGGLTLF